MERKKRVNKKIWENPQEYKELDEAEVPLWFWNDKLQTSELKCQLKLMTEIGVTCTNPHARTNNGEGYIGGYLDEEWFQNFDVVMDYKKDLKEPLWLYDEMDWPAGTCNQTITKDERYREQYLTFQKIEIPSGNIFSAQLKELTGKPISGYKWENLNDQDDYAFNVYLYNASNMVAINIKDYFKPRIFGPELEFKSDQDAIAYIVKIQVDAFEYGGNGQVSYINKDATKAFLKSTYDKYYEHYGEDFGEIITSVFNDETRMCNALPWSREFHKEFKAQKGYNLMPHLVELILTGEKAGRIKCDYYDVLANLYQKNYFGVIHDWCKKHNLKLFAHLLGEETMYGHVRYSGDYLRQNRCLDIPGADHLGKGIGSLNIKYTASGAHSYGKDITGVEVFAGCGWDMTFYEYIRIITWMFQMGMKIIINHGFFYSDRGERKNDWPPSQFFQWQGWEHMKEGNAMIRRLHHALTGGRSEVDLLVYYPIESFWLQYEPDLLYYHGFEEGAFLRSEQAVKIDQEMQLLLNSFLSQNLDFELLHKDALENFKVREAAIENIKNGQRFNLLILPMCRVLPIEAARLLREFVEHGGHIIALDEIPKLAMPESADKELEEIFLWIHEQGGLTELSIKDKSAICQAVKQRIPHRVNIVKGMDVNYNNHMNYPSYLIDPYLHNGEDLTGVMFTRYRKGKYCNILFVNYGKQPETIQVELETKSKPEIWNPFTGEISIAKVLEERETYMLIELVLPVNYGLIVVVD